MSATAWTIARFRWASTFAPSPWMRSRSSRPHRRSGRSGSWKLLHLSQSQLFRLAGWQAPAEMRWPELRLTVDEPEDYELVRRVFETLLRRGRILARRRGDALRRRPEWVAINSAIRQKAAAEG